MRSDAQKNITLIADPKILAIDIFDNQEPIVDLNQQQEIAYGLSPEISNNTDYTKLRKTVHDKLKYAQSLLPNGLRFCLYEGYRSISLQKMLFEKRYDKIKSQHADWTHKEIFNETINLVSPVINLDGSTNIPPHSTGGAFDVYLIDDQGLYIEMGIHPKDWMQDDGSLSLTASKVVSAEAQENRNIMSEVLLAVGFVNYSTEYWHWSYGDRYWAYHLKEPHAIYGTIQKI